MSDMGHFRRFGTVRLMSAYAPIADMATAIDNRAMCQLQKRKAAK
jgi:hypothetical protein